MLHGDTGSAFLLLYVDDIVLTASTPALLRQLQQRMFAEFSMKDLGALHYFLGICVMRTADGFFLSQRKYADELLDRANMMTCKPASTPIDTRSKLSAAAGAPVQDASEYRSLVGALQYITLTRPDMAYAVQQACLYMHDPRTHHLALVKRILRYLRGMTTHGCISVAPPSSPWSPTLTPTGPAARTRGALRRASSSTSVMRWCPGPPNASPPSRARVPRPSTAPSPMW